MANEEIQNQVKTKIENVRQMLAAEISSHQDVCLTCSFQAEDVLLTKIAIELNPRLPILFLDTGYHFKETYEYRDRIAGEWSLNLINLLPEQSVAEQEREHGILYRSAPDRCCQLRKVEPLFKAVAAYRIWITGLRREQAKSRAALEERSFFSIGGNEPVLKLAPLVSWTSRDVWYACEQLSIPRLSLYERGFTSIGCKPCTSLPLDPNDPRSGRWGGHKVECGIHIEAAPGKR